MKRLLLLLSIILFSFLNGQEYWMEDGSVTTCSGTFYDSGGPVSPIQNNENLTYTICPDRTGEPDYATVLTFTSILMQNGPDYIEIYDGSDTSAPLLQTLTGGSLGVPASPLTISASENSINPTGCLTIVFISDSAGPGPGWVAEISCDIPCQAITPTVTTTPAMDDDGNVTILEGESVSFTGSATFSLDSTGATYIWDFGDGTTATGLTQTHTYADAGTYTVSFTVTDGSGDADCSKTYTFLVIVTYDNNVPCPSVEGVDFVENSSDVTVNCNYPLDEDGCMRLTADYAVIKETSSYVVQSIPFQPPYSITDYLEEAEISIDDTWAPVSNFPAATSDTPAFKFCFFGVEQPGVQVGANGRLNFDLNRPVNVLNSDQWQFSSSLPLAANTPDPDMFNTINGAYHDINTQYDSNRVDDFTFGFEGTYPCRMFVVNYYDIPLFSCTSSRTSQQIVLWEGSNYIDVYLHNKPACPGWNSGNSLVGVQGPNVGQFAVAPGRNTGNWSAQNEAWRFIPDGPPMEVEIEWFDETGNRIGTGQNLDVCPRDDTFYTVEVTYEICGQAPITVSDQININFEFVEPEIEDLTVEVCDAEGDGSTTWDLFSYTYDVVNDPNWTVQGFYPDFRSADQMISEDMITTPDAFVSGTTTVYVRVEDSSNGCHGVFAINLDFLEGLMPDPLTDTQCVPPTTPEAVYNLNTFNDHYLEGQFYDIFYYANETDAQAGNDNHLQGTDLTEFTITETTIVYVRIETADGCFGLATLTLELTDGPDDYEFTEPVQFCDNPELGTETVDLTGYENEISGTQTGITYFYYEVYDDAANHNTAAAIADPTQYLLNSTTTTIWIVAVDENGCYKPIEMPVALLEGLDLTAASITLCDVGNDGTENFDLGSVNEDIIPNSDQYTFTYYPTEDGANNGTNPVTSDITAYASGNGFVWVVVSTAQDCSSVTSIELILDPTPEINPVELAVCADADGNYVFNLTDAESQLLGSQTGLTLTYFNNEIDANENNTANAISDPTVYTGSEGEIIYVRLENEECFSVSQITLHENPAPVADVSPAIQVCDLDANGSETVDLTQNEAVITGGATDVTVTYYLSQTDAETPANPITDPVNYTASEGTTVIYVRVETAEGCFAIASFEVIIDDGLTLAPGNLELCDLGGDGSETWDLTLDNETIIGNSTDYTFVYYPTQADLEAGTNAITDPLAFVSGNNTLYVLVTNAQGCFSDTTLTLTLTDGPVINPAALSVCADADGNLIFNLTEAETDLLGGQTGLTLSYYNSFSDADTNNTSAAIADPSNYTGTDGEIIYVRLEDANGCHSVSELTLNASPAPVVNQGNLLQACDADASGSEAIDITQNESIITGGATDVTVTYYLSQADAETPQNAITNPATYDAAEGTTTIYVRVENADGCFAVTSFDVTISDGLTLAPGSLEQCDPEEDGTEIWNLTLDNETIIANSANYTFQYYPTQADLNNGTNEINSPTAYASGNGTVYVLVTSTDGCFSDTTLTLTLTDGPQANPAELSVCADDNGNFIFDLNDADAQILNGQQGITLTYYENQADAENNNTANAITNINSYSVTVSSVVYVHMTDGNCSSVATITLTALPEPVATQPSNIVVCDEDESGDENVDLTSVQSVIIGTQTGLTVTYHLSQADADNNSNPILNPAAYNVADGTITVYVRVDNGDCFATTSFDVTVNEGLPLNEASITLCDVGEDNTEIFDLTSMNSVISGNVSGYTWQYFTSIADMNNDNPITGDVTQYASGNATIIVMASNANNCSSYTELQLILEDLPAVVANQELTVCDPEFDGVYGFTLTDLNDLVVNNTSGFTFEYYTSLSDAENQVNPYSQASANNVTSLPMQVFVRVTETGGDPVCSNFTSVTLTEGDQTQVNTNIDPLTACDSGFGNASFDLTEMADFVTNESSGHTISYHSSLANAQNDTNPINPDNASLSNGTVFVRVTADGKCPSITQFDVVISPKPPAEIFSPVNAFCTTDSIQISANSFNPNLQYAWTNQTGNILGTTETIQLIGTDGDQTVTLTVTDPATECVATTTMDFDAVDVPVITNLNTTNNSISVSASGQGPFEYSIDGVNWQQSPTFDDLLPGMYTVLIRSVNGQCEGISMATLVLDVANIITPNGDGLNDFFKVPFMDAFRDEAGNVQPSNFYIYDRYGKLLHEDVSSNEKTEFIWRGTSNGRALPSGDYWYLLRLADGRSATGHITVKHR